MTTKIIFSDGKVQFLKAADKATCDKLKEAQSDKKLNELLTEFEGSIEFCEAADASEVQCTVDLLKIKQSSVKRMKKAFGGR